MVVRALHGFVKRHACAEGVDLLKFFCGTFWLVVHFKALVDAHRGFDPARFQASGKTEPVGAREKHHEILNRGTPPRRLGLGP
jgi:hypothetical protein